MINTTVSKCSSNTTFQHNSSLDTGKEYEIKIIVLSHDGGTECDITPPNNKITTTDMKKSNLSFLLAIAVVLLVITIMMISCGI